MRRGPLASRLFPALPFVVLAGAFLAGGPAGCAARAERSGLELPPTTGGDLAVEIRYPPAGAALTASDSTFVFGRVTGAPGAEVTLTVNGESVPVHPEGGWIAFLPVRPDSFAFQVRAEAGGRVAEAERTVWVPRPLYAVGSDTLPYRPGTIEPLGPLEVYAGDTISVSVVAAPGLQVRARLGDEAVRLLPQPAREVNRGRQVWGSEDQVEGFRPAIWIQAADAARGRRPGPWLRYAGDVFAQLGGGLTDSLTLEFADGQGEPLVVPIAGVSYLDPTRVGVAALHDDTAGTGHTDGRVVARTGPGLGYELLLPNGTVAATGRRAGDWREIVLGPGTRAWVPLAETLPIEAPRPRDVIAVVRTRVRDGWSEVVLPLQVALPFAVEQELDPVRYAIRVYGLLSNVDWIETTIADPLIRSVRWSEPADGVFRLDVDLAGDRAWGWRSYREGTHLVIGFRHPPATGGGCSAHRSTASGSWSIRGTAPSPGPSGRPGSRSGTPTWRSRSSWPGSWRSGERKWSSPGRPPTRGSGSTTAPGWRSMPAGRSSSRSTTTRSRTGSTRSRTTARRSFTTTPRASPWRGRSRPSSCHGRGSTITACGIRTWPWRG